MKRIQLKNSILQDVAMEAALTLSKGGLVVAPFDTVYGILVDPSDNLAVGRVNEIKGRPGSKTIGLATCSAAEISRITYMDIDKEEFIAKKAPGKYTFILKEHGQNSISDLCKRDGNLAIRVPDSQLILEIIRLSGGLVAQTSANKSGQPNCYSIEDIENQFIGLDQFDLIIDGGLLAESLPSELWDLTGVTPRQIERS